MGKLDLIHEQGSIGLVLSGGGARGIAHLGLLKALGEWGIVPNFISGTSAGAIVGAFYSAGYKPEEVLDLVKKTKMMSLFKPAGRGGLLRIEHTGTLYQKYLPPQFESLQIPLWISASDIQRGRTEFFSSGELILPLQASSCLPVVFSPVKIGNDLFVDGGLLNNLPVEPLIGKAGFIIGSHTNHIGDFKPVGNMRRILERVFLLGVNQTVTERKKKCHLLIEPHELSDFRMYEVSKADEMFKLGYESTAAILKAIEAGKKDVEGLQWVKG